MLWQIVFSLIQNIYNFWFLIYSNHMLTYSSWILRNLEAREEMGLK